MAEKTPFTLDKTTGIRITLGAILSIVLASVAGAQTLTNIQSEITHAQTDIVDLKALTKEQEQTSEQISTKLSAQNQNIKDIKSDVTDIKAKVYK